MMNATYVNTDERYGNAELVTISDYRELNPDGEFEVRTDGIYELVRITYGHNEWKRIADVKPEYHNSVSTVGGMRWEDRYYGDTLSNSICSGVAIVMREADYNLNGRVFRWELSPLATSEEISGRERTADGAKWAAIDAYNRYVNHAENS